MNHYRANRALAKAGVLSKEKSFQTVPKREKAVDEIFSGVEWKHTAGTLI
jgi:hypothetical protein